MEKIKIENIAVTGKVNDSFIGIKIRNNEIKFYYPETYELANSSNLKDYRDDVLSILKTIAIAKTLTTDKAKESNVVM